MILRLPSALRSLQRRSWEGRLARSVLEREGTAKDLTEPKGSGDIKWRQGGGRVGEGGEISPFPPPSAGELGEGEIMLSASPS